MADGEPTRKELQPQFLAAHHFLIFGGKEDIPVAAELLKQDAQFSSPPAAVHPRGPNLEVREMALMARLSSKSKPEDFGMKENAARCPSHTVKAFIYPSRTIGQLFSARFLP